MLARTPLFAAVVVATVAVGVGGVATIFSALNAVVLRPLPATTDGGRLVGIERRTPDASEGVSASYAFYRYLSATSHSFDGVAAWARVPLTIARGGQGFAAAGNIVSGNYFAVLGVRPAAGRFFLPEEDAEALAHPVLVVSYAFWKRQLGSEASAIGSVVLVNGREYRLVGVAPAGFHGVFTPITIDAWVPLAVQPHVAPARDLQGTPWLWVFARLRDGASVTEARAESASLMAARTASAEDSPVFRRYVNARLTPLTGLPDDARRMLLGFGAVLLGAATLVLVIAGANVSSLLAARAVSRRREIGIRVALGATRARLVRQLLTETVALFLMGALGGTLIAFVATRALEQLPLPADASLSLELTPDVRVLILAIAIALIVGVTFGAGPAMRGVVTNPGTLLRLTSAAAGRRTFTARALIVGQVMCSLVLLTSAGLFLRSLLAGAAIEPGFDEAGVVVSKLDTEAYGYDSVRGRAFYDALRRGLERAPDVEAVSFSTMVPLTFADSGGIATIDAVPGKGAQRLPFRHAFAAAPAISRRCGSAAVGTRLRRGRRHRSARRDRQARPSRDQAWGKAIRAAGRSLSDRRITVIAVARDSHYTTLDEAPMPFVYFPIVQQWPSEQTLFVRGRGGVAPRAALIDAEVLAFDPSLPRPVVSTLRDETAIVLLPQRVAAIVTATLGGLGLLLAAVGLYGLVAHTIALRMREIGVRMALGARSTAVVRLMLTDSVRLVAAGTALGLAASLLATRLLARYLLTVSPLDPLAFAGAAIVLTAVTIAASAIPARRAGRVSPVDVLARDGA